MGNRIYLILVLMLFLSACQERAEKISFDAMPEELSGCKIFFLRLQNAEVLKVMRCPLSETSVSTKKGKLPSETTITIDGVN